MPAHQAGKVGARIAIAAPRGEAKSTIVSQIFVLWCVVTGRKRYVPIIMDSFDQAATMLPNTARLAMPRALTMPPQRA